MKKRIVLLLVTSLLLMVFSTNALAFTDSEKNDEYSEIPTEGTMSPYPNIGYGSSYSQESHGPSLLSDYGKIAIGSVSIEEISTGRIEIYASSTASKTVDEVGYVVHLQKWDGYKWNIVSSNKKTEYNAFKCRSYHNGYVERGKYYRASVVHYVIDNNKHSSLVSTSNYIQIK